MDVISSAQKAVEKFSWYFWHRGSPSGYLQWGITEVKAPQLLGLFIFENNAHRINFSVLLYLQNVVKQSNVVLVGFCFCQFDQGTNFKTSSISSVTPLEDTEKSSFLQFSSLALFSVIFRIRQAKKSVYLHSSGSFQL